MSRRPRREWAPSVRAVMLHVTTRGAGLLWQACRSERAVRTLRDVLAVVAGVTGLWWEAVRASPPSEALSTIFAGLLVAPGFLRADEWRRRL